MSTGASQDQSRALHLDLRRVGGAVEPGDERHQQLLPQLVLQQIVEAEREQRDRPREGRRAVVDRMHRAVAVAGGNDRRLVDAGAAIGPWELVAAAQELPVQHALEVGGGPVRNGMHVQQTVEVRTWQLLCCLADLSWHQYFAKIVASQRRSDGSRLNSPRTPASAPAPDAIVRLAECITIRPRPWHSRDRFASSPQRPIRTHGQNRQEARASAGQDPVRPAGIARRAGPPARPARARQAERRRRGRLHRAPHRGAGRARAGAPAPRHVYRRHRREGAASPVRRGDRQRHGRGARRPCHLRSKWRWRRTAS